MHKIFESRPNNYTAALAGSILAIFGLLIEYELVAMNGVVEELLLFLIFLTTVIYLVIGEKYLDPAHMLDRCKEC